MLGGFCQHSTRCRLVPTQRVNQRLIFFRKSMFEDREIANLSNGANYDPIIYLLIRDMVYTKNNHEYICTTGNKLTDKESRDKKKRGTRGRGGKLISIRFAKFSGITRCKQHPGTILDNTLDRYMVYGSMDS